MKMIEKGTPNAILNSELSYNQIPIWKWSRREPLMPFWTLNLAQDDSFKAHGPDHEVAGLVFGWSKSSVFLDRFT